VIDENWEANSIERVIEYEEIDQDEQVEAIVMNGLIK